MIVNRTVGDSGGERRGLRRSQRLLPDGDGEGGEGYRDLSAFMIVNRTAGEWGEKLGKVIRRSQRLYHDGDGGGGYGDLNAFMLRT
jgi:hypothetical protein